MVYNTTSTNTPLLTNTKNYSNYREATNHLSETINETKRWIAEGVITLEEKELDAYLKFVVLPAVVARKVDREVIEELVNAKNIFTLE